MSLTAASLNEKMMIPDMLRAAPALRGVLDRYGLRGCGGPLGPVESLGFFAQAHEVALDHLLDELRHQLQEPPSARPQAATVVTSRADQLYRPFFKAGIAVALTLGAAWGAALLLQIGFSGSFTAVSVQEINAHGHAQIFGWVGLFVMGFAYQAFPRFKHADLACPRLAYATLWLMLAGIASRSISQPLTEYVPWLWWPAVTGSILEILAVGLFVFILGATWRRAARPLAFYDFYIIAALVWFVVQAIYESVYLTATLSAAGPDLVALVATWQAPLREIQIHGFALLMILGVSQRIFHHFYGLPAADARLSKRALICLNVAIVGEVAGLLWLRLAGPGGAVLWYAAVLLLAGTSLRLVWSWRLWSRPAESDRSLKFLRTAYAWLFFSLAMLVLVPAYQYGLLRALAPESAASRLGFSHAYYGAIRHAITVGFISMMIVGVAAKVVPTLNGLDVRSLSALWGPFALLNTGCLLRVSGQTATDFTSTAYPLTGVSGLLEVAGLLWWGGHLWAVMTGRIRQPCQSEEASSLGTEGMILPSSRVGEVLDRYPELLETFVAHGFKPLQNPLLRRTLARRVTLETACRMMGVDCGPFLDALNSRKRTRHERISLPMYEAH